MISDPLSGAHALLWGIAASLPKIIFAIIFALIGILIGWLANTVLRELFTALKIDKLLAHTGLDEAMTRAGYKLDSGRFVGEIVRWFCIVAFLIFSFNILGMTQVNQFLLNVVTNFIPNVLIAVLIIFAGSILADVLAKIVAGGADMVAHNKTGKMLGTITRIAIWAFTILIALGQLRIATFYLQTLYQAIVFMIAIAGALAFGLGGKEAAAKTLEKLSSSMKQD